ncbi:hypothetical protein JTB14_015581 [Gonioctena quinquepunctata]|nr:hypothetical protein JTB14_015581 [Gonioctena quinquepunctata]
MEAATAGMRRHLNDIEELTTINRNMVTSIETLTQEKESYIEELKTVKYNYFCLNQDHISTISRETLSKVNVVNLEELTKLKNENCLLHTELREIRVHQKNEITTKSTNLPINPGKQQQKDNCTTRKLANCNDKASIRKGKILIVSNKGSPEE